MYKLRGNLKSLKILLITLTLVAVRITPLLTPEIAVPPMLPVRVGDLPFAPIQQFEYADYLQPDTKPTGVANRSDAGQEISTILADAEQPEVVAVVSPLIKESVLGTSIVVQHSGETYPNYTYETTATPNDPAANQWWLTAVNASQAWDVSTGSNDTTLAIIDTGFALNHEEFTGRWHQNGGEQGITTTENPSLLNCTDQNLSLNLNCNLIDDDFDGIVDNELGPTDREQESQYNCTDQALPIDKSCNLVDDDANGLIDDWRGWDFVNFDRSAESGETDRYGLGTRHGTNVAGVAAATGNNGVGLAGVNWSTKILPLQALSDEGSGTTLSVARAIRYAVDQGADVISMSLGGQYPDSFLRQAIREAVAADVVVVAAAGNNGCNCISYPANYEEVVAVGALNQSNQRASFSSYGANLDVMAPGTGMYSTDWRASNTTTAYASGVAGTSFAAPVVSASLALLKGLNPTASASELVSLLTQSNSRLTLTVTQHRSDTLGFGVVNLQAAATRAITPVHTVLRTGLADVSHGTMLVAGMRFESLDTPQLYMCAAGQLGTTPVYRLQSGTRVLFSSSTAEVAHAVSTGFSANLLGYYCVALPHDTADSIRNINTHQEFTNSQLK